MITLAEALAIIWAHIEPLAVRQVGLSQSSGYVLARPVEATEPIPRFDHSAMDGFGVCTADVASTPTSLRVQGTICAGDCAIARLAEGQAVKIFTGAPIPRGVDAVVMKEYCTEENGVVLMNRAVRVGDNIRRMGEEFCPGDPVLPAGIRITPPMVGLLATLGYTKVPVRRKPTVAVLVTGSELASPGEALRPGQILRCELVRAAGRPARRRYRAQQSLPCRR